MAEPSRAGGAGVRLAIMGLLLLATPHDARAQDGAALHDVAAPTYSAAFVPRGHWSEHAVRRLAALGLAPGLDPSMRLPSQKVVGDVLRAAATRDDLPADLAALAGSWDRRFRREFAIDAGSGMLPALAGSSAAAGYVRATGVLDSGWGYVDGDPAEAVWHAPAPAPDTTGVDGAVRLQVSPLDRAALAASGSVRSGFGEIDELYAAAAIGATTFWLGRRIVAYGPGSEGIVLTRAGTDGLGVQTSAFRLPWLLRHVGPVSAAFTLGQADLERSYDDVFFLTTRASVTPHPRLTLGVSRAAHFGGDGNGDVDAFDVFSVLVGKHAGDIASELDNQVVAVDVDFRAPLERWLPLRLYVEWGFEDSAGAWRNVPGVLAGIEVPGFPGLGELALRVERTSFAQSCCGNPAWYRHSNFQDGWTQDRVPMGHSLGGHGDEWSFGADLDLPNGIGAQLRGFTRWRGAENLYWPNRAGDSSGFQGALVADLGEHLRIDGSALVEGGSGWRNARLAIALRALL